MMSEKAAVGMWGPTDHPKNSCGHGKIQWIWEGARFSSKADRINLNHRDFALLQKKHCGWKVNICQEVKRQI